LTHVRLLVEDYKACFKFYTETVGLKVSWGNENTGYAELDTGDARLSIFTRDEMAKVVGSTALSAGSGCQDRHVVILRVPDVDAACEDLQGKDVDFVTEPQDRSDWGIRTAHLSTAG
jgi:lactoylglutathione lyase